MKDLLRQLFDLLDLHFPDDPTDRGPPWYQINYKETLFELFLKCRTLPELNSDAIAHEVRYQWCIQRTHKLNNEQDRDLDDLLLAWREWEYAHRKLIEEKSVQAE